MQLCAQSSSQSRSQVHHPLLDGHSDFFAFSTGRRAAASLHTTFTLRPRHDFFQYAYQVIRGLVDLDLNYFDEVELDLTFQDTVNVPECVWAIVSKAEMKTIRDRRWDLVCAHTHVRDAN